VHIGDSRAYRRRGGQLLQLTHDHSRVQAMVDDGRLTPDEAAAHPGRAVLLRALDGRAGPAADVRLHTAGVGDRYLLCSDGLSAVVPAAEITRVVHTVADPETAVQDLVDLARDGGAPDNVSCVVADVIAC
jgi:serine/threonine protein phosphatase PrpC